MNNTLLSSRSLHTDFAILLLRLIFGGMFTYLGYMKIDMYNQIAPTFPGYFGMSGKMSFHLVIFAELVCGALVALGFLTRLAILPICFTMIVVYFMAHKDDPYHLKQLPFLFLLLTPVIFILGSGKYSLDRLLFKR